MSNPPAVPLRLFLPHRSAAPKLLSLPPFCIQVVNPNEERGGDSAAASALLSDRINPRFVTGSSAGWPLLEGGQLLQTHRNIQFNVAKRFEPLFTTTTTKKSLRMFSAFPADLKLKRSKFFSAMWLLTTMILNIFSHA